MFTKDVTSDLMPTNFFKKINNILKKAKILTGYWFIQKMKISQRDLEPVPTVFNKIGDFLLKPFVNKDAMTHILMGPLSFQIFRVSHDIGLFSYLNSHPGATLKDIAAHLNIERYPAEILLLGLTGLKLIKKIENSYYNSGLIKIVTQDNTNKFTYFFPKYMQYAHHILSQGIHYLQESITENKPVGLQKIFGNHATDYYYELSKNETASHHFAQHMSAFSQINADRLSNLFLFKKIKKLLDVGGGIGDVAISIIKQNPDIRITVYDHPEVAQLANKKFQEAALSHKLNAIGADVASNPFPENYDGVLFSHFIDIFSPEMNIEFFKRAFNSLASEGYIIIYTPVVNDNETGPLVNCLLGIYFLCLANGKGRFYSCAQISDWLKEVGYINVKTYHLPSSEAIIVGVKP